MKRVLSVLVLSLVASLPAAAQSPLPPPAKAPVDYDKDVKPLLAQHCYGCHGPDVQQSGLRLDLRQNALRGGDYGPVIVPGKSAESKLIRRLVDGDGGLQMPPTGALDADEIGVLRAWIDQGAEFRTDVIAEAPPLPVDPRLADLITAVRSMPRSALEARIPADRALVNATDAAGSTLLHHAAGFGTVDTLALLIDQGAEVGTANRRRSTPLHWAVPDEAKVKLLLERGAAVNARNVEGRTALYLAASMGSGAPAVRLLIARGADPNLALAGGRTPLMAAALRGDIDVVRLLLDAKANINAKDGAGETPLMFAATDGNPELVRLLLDRGADPLVRTKRNETALGNASTAGNEAVIRLLLDRGAEVNVRNIRGFSPLMLAASSDSTPAAAVQLLLAKGADTSFTGDYDETARDLAAKRGDTAVTRLLGGMPSRPAAPIASHAAMATPRSIPDAVERALAMAEKQSYNFIRTGGCNSCHSQDLPSAAAGYARSRGLKAPAEIPQLPQAMMPSPERVMDLSIVNPLSTAWELFDFGMNGVPRSAYTDAAVRALLTAQTPQGNWSANESRRPPMASGEYQGAAIAIYAIAHYAPAGHEATVRAAIARAAAWLEKATPESTQDRAFHLLALSWADGNADVVKRSARALAAMQRTDGGWSQLAGTDSDAYATGQALFALNTAARMATSDPIHRKGVEYLLKTQAADGTWHVKSRSIWLQPYFESGFPYGQDQFISTAGTAWAAMALAATVPPRATTEQAARQR